MITAVDAHARNTLVVSTGALDWSRPESWTGALDRSPCAAETCAKTAAMHAKGRLAGQAWITGFAQYVLDPDDPYPNGFTVGDIWGKT